MTTKYYTDFSYRVNHINMIQLNPSPIIDQKEQQQPAYCCNVVVLLVVAAAAATSFSFPSPASGTI